MTSFALALLLAGAVPSAQTPPPPAPVCQGLIQRVSTQGGLWPLTTTALPLTFVGPCPATTVPFVVNLELCIESLAPLLPLTISVAADGLELPVLRASARDGVRKTWHVLPAERVDAAGRVFLTTTLEAARFRQPGTGEVALRLEFLLAPWECEARGSSGVSIRTVTLDPPPGS